MTMTNNDTTIRSDITVNDTILLYPATLSVFKSLGIDSCCGGGLTVAEASSRHGHDVNKVMDLLVAVALGKTAA